MGGGGGSSWGESTISRRSKVDNYYLEHQPELAKLMFDKSTGLNKQDIDRITASACNLDIPILGKSLSVWTCPYWSRVFQHPEFFLVHTIDGDTSKYRQRGSGSSSGSGSDGSNAGNDGGNSSNSGGDTTISYSPPPPPAATTPTAADDIAIDDDGSPVDVLYSCRYDKACEQVLGTVTEVKEKIETTLQYVRSISNLSSAWVHNCVTMAPYIKIIKYHVLIECNIDPITNRDRNRNKQISLMTLFYTAYHLAQLVREHHPKVLGRQNKGQKQTQGQRGVRGSTTGGSSKWKNQSNTQIYQSAQKLPGVGTFLVRSWLYIFNHRASTRIKKKYRPLLESLRISTDDCDYVCRPKRLLRTLCACHFVRGNIDKKDLELTNEFQTDLISYFYNISRGTDRHPLDIPMYMREIKTTPRLAVDVIQPGTNGKTKHLKISIRKRKRRTGARDYVDLEDNDDMDDEYEDTITTPANKSKKSSTTKTTTALAAPSSPSFSSSSSSSSSSSEDNKKKKKKCIRSAATSSIKSNTRAASRSAAAAVSRVVTPSSSS